MTHPLPPGQLPRNGFPRFGLTGFAKRFPRQLARIDIEVSGRVSQQLKLTAALEGLPRVEQVSDFHCVTTWSTRSLRWGGVRFKDFHERILLPQACPESDADLVALRAQDGARTAMRLADLLAPDVLLADMLDGEPLTIAHGAPVRLVAPAHYGYKSIKHLCRIDFRRSDEAYPVSGFRFMDHPRARVALEERGRVAPGWVLRFLYRPLIARTVSLFEKAMMDRANAAASNERAD